MLVVFRRCYCEIWRLTTEPPMSGGSSEEHMAPGSTRGKAAGFLQTTSLDTTVFPHPVFCYILPICDPENTLFNLSITILLSPNYSAVTLYLLFLLLFTLFIVLTSFVGPWLHVTEMHVYIFLLSIKLFYSFSVCFKFTNHLFYGIFNLQCFI